MAIPFYNITSIVKTSKGIVEFYIDTTIQFQVSMKSDVQMGSDFLGIVLVDEQGIKYGMYCYDLVSITDGTTTQTYTPISSVSNPNSPRGIKYRVNEVLEYLNSNIFQECCDAGGAGVQSVTGNIVDNTDPLNPVVTQVQADWTETDSLLPSYILNKPADPATLFWPLAGNIGGPNYVTGSIEIDPAASTFVLRSNAGGILLELNYEVGVGFGLVATNAGTGAVGNLRVQDNTISISNTDTSSRVGGISMGVNTVQVFVDDPTIGTGKHSGFDSSVTEGWATTIDDGANGDYVIGIKFNPYTDSATYPYITVIANLRFNFAGIAAPAVTDDSGKGYGVNSMWFYNGTMYICSDATIGAAVWATAGGSTSPAGSNTQIQYNNSGSFGAEAAFTYDQSTNKMTVDNILLNSSTASRILSTDGSKNITALDTSTYPSLTELSYVKGATATNIRNYMSIGGTMSNDTASTGTRYYSPYGGLDASAENQRECILLVSGTVKTWYLNTSGAQPVGGASTWTVRQNTAATALTFVVAAGSAAGTFSDLTHSFSGTAGDRLSLEVVSAGGATSAAINSSGFVIEVS